MKPLLRIVAALISYGLSNVSGYMRNRAVAFPLVAIVCGWALMSPSNVFASPILYQFTWQGSGTLTQSFQNLASTMTFAGSTNSVISADYPDSSVAVNGILQPLIGEFAGGGMTGQSYPAQVARGTDKVLGQTTISFLEAGTQSAKELSINATGYPGIETYDLRSSIGPVAGPGGVASDFSLDLGEAGVLTFNAISAASFQAIASAQSDAISYLFSWTGDGSLVRQINNATFEMSFLADTDSVISADYPDSSVAVNGTLQPLIGEFAGGGMTGQSYPAQVARGTDKVLGQTTISFLEAGTQSAKELSINATGYPGIENYDLRSSIGPVAGPGGVASDFSLDLGEAGVLAFSTISAASFQAIQNPVEPIPEPSSLATLVVGLAGLLLTKRKSKPV